MSRNPLGIFTGAEALHPVWAGDPTADRVAMSDFGDGYGDQYTGSVFPDRRNLNHVLAYVSAIGDDVNKGGAGLVWDSEIEYNVTAQTVFNGQIYVCVNSANKGHEPSLSSYYWSNLVDFLGIVQPKDDIKYIPFSVIRHTLLHVHHQRIELIAGAGSLGLVLFMMILGQYISSFIILAQQLPENYMHRCLTVHCL